MKKTFRFHTTCIHSVDNFFKHTHTSKKISVFKQIFTTRPSIYFICFFSIVCISTIKNNRFNKTNFIIVTQGIMIC